MKLLSIHVGRPVTVDWNGNKVLTGIFKKDLPPSGTYAVGVLNIEGDEQADLTVHGGRDKAVYAYSAATLASWWKKRLGRDVLAGELGENLTFDVLDESKIYIGSIYQLGSVRLQVTQPRFPCFKLGIKFGDMKILRTFFESRCPGVYFRVLKTGKIGVNDALELIHEEPQKVSVRTIFEWDPETEAELKALAKRVRAIPDLAPSVVRIVERAARRFY